MATNLNTNPYYDDFNEFKNYHQILFRPSYAVQARELTQIQTILKNQIAKFGDHVFKHGSVVIPGNTFAELATPYIKLESQYLGSDISVSLFENQLIVGSVTGIRAIITKIVPAVNTDPITFYISYISGGVTAGEPNGYVTFLPLEEVYLENNTTIRATIQSAATAVGFGSVAYVNTGVYYINGTFVSVDAQSVVIDKYGSEPSCHVLFKINEEIINSDSDDTLLDPAQGSYNFAAPGADRLKISLTLTTLALDAAITSDYVELMRYNNGVLEEHSRYPKYNELEKSLAMRTYEESGDYVVSGFDINPKEHLRVNLNGGVYPLADGGDEDKIVYSVSSGKAYVNGFGVEKLSAQLIEAPKARTAAHVSQDAATIKTSYGQVLLVTGIVGAIDTNNQETVQLWNSSNLGDASDVQIGTAIVMALDYYDGDGSTSPIFKLYVRSITLNTGYSYEDIASVRTVSGSSAKVVNEYIVPLTAGAFDFDATPDVINTAGSVRSATVAFWNPTAGKLYAHKHLSTKASPKVGEAITGSNSAATGVIRDKSIVITEGQSSLIFPLPRTAVKALKTASNTSDFTFTYNRKLLISSGSSTTPTISSGTIVPIEAGTLVAITSSGLVDESNFKLNGAGTAIEYRPAGVLTNVGTDTHLYCQIRVTNAQPRAKVVTNRTQNLAAAAEVTLDRADVFEITSITLGGVDVMSYYRLDQNISDYAYGYSRLILKNGLTQPVGTLSITYKYYQHGSGDFFSVDSYPDYDDVPKYISVTSGIEYDMRDCIDFRQSIGTASNIVVDDSVVSTSFQRYLGRYDSVVIDMQSKMGVIQGTPSDSPKQPFVPAGSFELGMFYVPPYTDDVSQIKMTRKAIQRFTMKDIKTLENRVQRLEEFSLLTAAEAELTKINVTDAESGLDRYKTGYVVETFVDPFAFGDVFREEFRATMNGAEGLFAYNEMHITNLTGYSGSANTYATTGGVLTLPYTEVPLAKVGVSSRTTNLNPFLVVKWSGSMNVHPSIDTWVEVVDLPEIFKTVDRTVTLQVFVPIPNPAPAPAPAPATSPFVAGPWSPNPTFVVGPGSSATTAATTPVTVVGPSQPASTNTSTTSTSGIGVGAPLAAQTAPPSPASLPFWWMADEGKA